MPNSRELVSSKMYDTEMYRQVGHVPDIYLAFVAPDGRIFGIEDHFIYVSEDGGRLFRQLGVIPKANSGWMEQVKDFIARSKLVRTVRRNPGPTNLVVLSSGTILVFYDHIYRSTDNGSTFEPVFRLSSDTAAPFSYGEGIAVGPNDMVYFGEYVTAPRPHPVKIFQGTNDGAEWKLIWTFPPGSIFHIHSIQYDQYRSRYWITTGDDDAESHVFYTDDEFTSLHRLGGGSQDWRVVSIMITKDNLYWGSDNDRGPAAIFRWCFTDGRLYKMVDIGKPSYFSTILKDGTLVLSTTYEPESPYTKHYRPDPTADLWVSQDDGHWVKLLSVPYESRDTPWGPSRGFIAFPGGHGPHDLFFTPLGTRGNRYDTHVLTRNLYSYGNAANPDCVSDKRPE